MAKKPAKPSPASPDPAAVPPSSRKPGKPGKAGKGSAAYEAHKQRMTEASRERTAEGKEIGPLPAVANPERRAKCRLSLRLFCETYLSAQFKLSWSDDHLESIRIIEGCLFEGGLFAWAMPRGSGKSTLIEAAAHWAVAYGHRRFVVLIGANAEKAAQLLESIKMSVETNDAFAEDFPEMSYPIRCLEGTNARTPGQTLNGKRTRITWKDNEAIFPTVTGAKSSGAIIQTYGLTAAIRGAKKPLETGETLRPDFFIADDPQTDDSAISFGECNKRERRLKGAVKGLAGPGKTIAGVIPCTVIAQNDLSERLLDRERNPQFQGKRMKMLYSMPRNMSLWHDYAEIRRQWLKNEKQGDDPNGFYLNRRAEMDEGAKVAWKDRFEPGEISAIQSAMNLWCDDSRTFLAEYQNTPESDGAAGSKDLNPAEVAQRMSKRDRGVVAENAVRLTAFIDLGGGKSRGMAWGLCDWDSGFGGSVIDYGCWPKQNRHYFAWDNLQFPLTGPTGKYRGMAIEHALTKGLEELTESILGRKYPRQGGGEEMTVNQCLIDSGWMTPIVHQFVRKSRFRDIIYASKGVGRTIKQRGVSEWRPATEHGEKSGNAWRLAKNKETRERSIFFDPDVWKSFVYDRFTTPADAPGGMFLFGRTVGDHDMLCDHLTAEASEPITVRGLSFDKWEAKPGKPDNHLLDVVVGCAVAASVTGMDFRGQAGESAEAPKKVKKRADIEELYRLANGG